MDALLKKLNHKPGLAVTVLGAPPEVEPLVEAWSAETKVKRRLGRDEGFVVAFVRSAAELAERAPKLAAALVDDGVLWLAYPKRSSKRYTTDLSRDASWQPLGDLGMEPVRQVAIDADWSALRFRRAEHIARLERDPSRIMSAEGRRRSTRPPADPAPVKEFLAALPEDRRPILQRVHEVEGPRRRSSRRPWPAACSGTAPSTTATPADGRARPSWSAWPARSATSAST